MERRHLFEFNDLEAAPRFVRESITETLSRGLRWGRIYTPVAPVFAEFLAATRADSVLDLCSGAGEPAAILIDALEAAGQAAPSFLLSDLYPNPQAWALVQGRYPGAIDFIAESIDATNVPRQYTSRVRTVISAFHHFPPSIAEAMLADAARTSDGIFLLEAFPRSFRRLAATMPALGAALYANPLLAPRDRLAKALCTYALPVLPAIGLWDAAVSAMRAYDERDLYALAGRADPDGVFDWTYRRVPFSPGGSAVVFYGVRRF